MILYADGNYIRVIPYGGTRVGDLSSQLTLQINKGGAIDIE